MIQPYLRTLSTCLVFKAVFVESVLVCAGLHAATAQDSAVVAVDDSPSAEQLIAQAQDHALNNAAESARLVSRVLDEFGRKLVRVPGEFDRFIDARERAEEFLRTHAAVLAEFRRAQSGEGERLAADGLDRRLVESRLLTPAGLGGAVREAQRAVESAEFTRAQELLDSIAGHPDLETVPKATFATLATLAAWGLNDNSSQATELAKLAKSGDPEMIALGDRLGSLTRRGATQTPASIDPLGTAMFGPIPLVPVKLWSEPLEESLYARVQNSVELGAIAPSAYEGSPLSGRHLVSMPTVDGAVVLVNEGYVLRAYDAYSHRLRWYLSIGSPNAPGSDRQAGDLAVAVVASDCVLALSGHALGSERSGGGRLVCVDLQTGHRRWEIAPDHLSQFPEMRGLFFYGTPTVVGSTVVVLGRKVTPRLETVSMVVGVDLELGRVEWIAQVGASPGTRTAGSRPYTVPAIDGGRVIVSTGAGTTACVDAIDGRIRWIRRDPVPIRDMQQEEMPWEIGGAVVTTRGVLTLAPDATELQLLSLDDGHTIDSIPVGQSTAWGVTRYLLTDASRSLIYGIGNGITAFRIDDLRTPLWKFTGVTDGNSLAASIGRSPLRGRVQSGTLDDGSAGLIVPLDSGALLLHGQDGKTVQSIPCTGPANIVARDGVIAAVTNESLEIFVDAARAQRILTDAVSERPRDTDAIIGLVEFAMQARDADLLRSAVRWIEPALESVRDDSIRRERLIAFLIAAARSGLLGRDGSDDLFAAIVRAPCSDSDSALSHLAQGDWFSETDRVPRAVETWLALLADPGASSASLLDQSHEFQPVLRTASASVLLRIEALARAGAPSVAASGREHKPAGNSAEQLERFAAGLPCTEVAARAWLQAARARMGEGSVVVATGDASAAVDAALGAGRRDVVAEILDQSLSLLRELNLQVTSAQLLDHAVRRGFDVPLKSQGGIAASTALAMLPAAQFVAGLPRVTSSSSAAGQGSDIVASQLRGVLVPVRMVGASPSFNSRKYLVTGRNLTCVTAPNLDVSWSLPLQGEMPQVVPLREGLLVIDQPGRDALAAQWIDEAGELRWRINNLAAAAADEGMEPDGNEALVLPGSSDLMVVRRDDGAVCAFSLSDGLVRWRKESSVDAISSADAGEVVVVLAGTRSGLESQTSWMVALDQSTGAIVADVEVPDDQQVDWVKVVGPAEVAFGTSQGVGRWQVVGAAPGIRWFSFAPVLRTTDGGTPLASLLAVSGATDRTSIVRWDSGLIDEKGFSSSTGVSRTRGPHHWFRSGSVLVNWFNSGFEIFSLSGGLLGSSSLHGTRRIQSVLPTVGGLIAVEQLDDLNEPRAIGLARPASRILIHRFGWEDGGRITGPALEVEFTDARLDRPQVLDGWLLIGGPQSTLAIPLQEGG